MVVRVVDGWVCGGACMCVFPCAGVIVTVFLSYPSCLLSCDFCFLSFLPSCLLIFLSSFH